MAVNNSSILSNYEVEMNIVRQVAQSKYALSVLRYYIEIKNKTDNMIYIDKGNSFKIINDIATPFHDTKQVSVTSGNVSGASLGLGSIAGAIGMDGAVGQIAGGLSVGGSSSSSVSTTYSQQRILTIPPHSSAYISEHKWDNYKGNKWQQISEVEDFQVTYKGNPVKNGQYIEFNNNTSPCKYKYLITYSTEPDFKSFSYLNADLYIRYIVGALARVRGMFAYPCCSDSYGGTSQLYHWYNKIIPNFESVPSMLVSVTCWQ